MLLIIQTSSVKLTKYDVDISKMKHTLNNTVYFQEEFDSKMEKISKKLTLIKIKEVNQVQSGLWTGLSLQMEYSQGTF